MKGMGSYTPFERELGHYSNDEMNELYLSGKLDAMYDDFERTGSVPDKPKGKRGKGKKRKGVALT
ncbi:hypothetical protein [Bacillus gaemokensis]|uniref:Uncharacterized protein n=1 Tax=Bacillus gaemokensis TaxID=574375 RepID=A0A073KC09_9BACI|nr:hypothetical protein [Bacillus gaemokensis]KEK23962.1 hypothetical protein BAGA_06010 [Bacillus gaemokensis]KYG38083.1 hypothetical protein AZF08_20240 [Bacillus gaemokensis]